MLRQSGESISFGIVSGGGAILQPWRRHRQPSPIWERTPPLKNRQPLGRKMRKLSEAEKEKRFFPVFIGPYSSSSHLVLLCQRDSSRFSALMSLKCRAIVSM